MSFIWLADKPNRTREEIARIVHGVSLNRGLDELATVIALMTISVEVGANDKTGQRQWWCPYNAKDPQTKEFIHDSQSDDGHSSGYFQQQSPPGKGAWWGGAFGDREGARKRMTLVDSADMFLHRLADDYGRAAGNANLAGQFAQRVQGSAYPDRYAQRWDEAWTVLRRALSGSTVPPVATPPAQVGWKGDPVWLADVLRAEGVKVVELDGWRERGQGDFADIWGVMCHHTGGNNSPVSEIAFHPTLGLASQIHLAKDGTATLCGVGVANHSGRGSYPGLPTNAANNRLIGIEAVNLPPNGQPHRTSWAPAQYEAYVRICAAIIRRLGYRADRVISHAEWGRVAQGKWDPGSIDMNIFRADVQRQIDSKTIEEDWLNMPSNTEKLDAIYRELTQKLPSRSIYRTPGEGAVDTVAGMVLNNDAMAHQELVERLAVTYGDPDAVKRIFLVANGEGADPKDAWAIAHAREVIDRLPEEFRDNWKDA